jgi:integrase
MRFTQAAIEALTLPKGVNDLVVWDPSLPNFGVRLRPTSKSWRIQYRYNGRQRSESLGDVRQIKLNDARDVAHKRFAQIELGQDPQAERAKASAAALTLRVVVGRYIDFKKDRLRPSSFKAAQLHLTAHWKPLLDRPLAAIGRSDIAAQLQVIAKTRGRVAAQRARANLASLYGWSCREGLTEVNVVSFTNDPAAGLPSRDRVLSPDELKRVWLACEDCGSVGDIIKLLALTAQRRNEIADARWSEIDFDKATLVIPAARSKNRREHVVPLAPAAIDILNKIQQRGVEGDRVFATLSWTRSKQGVDRKIADLGKQAPWTIHDLRRSAATHMSEEPLNVQPHIVSAILNHTMRGVTKVYNRATYGAEKKQALNLWAEHLLNVIVGGRKGKIASLRRA